MQLTKFGEEWPHHPDDGDGGGEGAVVLSAAGLVDEIPRGLRFRLNGNSWHDRFVSEVEARAFEGAAGEGPGAGLLNQQIEVAPEELVDGMNRLELETDGTWTGSYRAAVVGVDLLLDD